MTRYTEIHNHSVNAVCNPSHKHSNIVFPEKKVSYSGEGIMKKKKKTTISHWNKQLPYHESNCFHWADKPQFNPLKLDFRLFLSLVESYYETYTRTGPISSKHVCIVTTRRMWKFQTNTNVNHISCMVSDGH